jgi:hypothetical protein
MKKGEAKKGAKPQTAADSLTEPVATGKPEPRAKKALARERKHLKDVDEQIRRVDQHIDEAAKQAEQTSRSRGLLGLGSR